MANAKDIQAAGAFVRLYLKDDMTKQLAKAVTAAGESLKSVGASAMKAGTAITAAGLAISAPFVAAVNTFSNFGDQLDKMSMRLGVSGQALAELGFAAEQSGGSIGDIEMNVRFMQRAMQDLSDGSKNSVATFAKLGLTLTDLQGLKPEEQFQLVADRINAIQDPTKKAAIAMDIFGRSGTALLPMLSDMRALREEARDLGLIPSEEEIKKSAEVNDAINRVKRTITAAFFNVGAAVAKPLLASLAVVTKLAKSAAAWVRENQDVVKTIAAIGAALTVAGSVITGLGAAAWAVGFALLKLSPIIAGIGAAFSGVAGLLLSPFRLLGAVASRAAGIVGGAMRTAGKISVAAFSGLRAGAAMFAPIAAGAVRAGAAIGRQIGLGVSAAIISFRSLRASGSSLGPAIGISLYRGIRAAVAPITEAMAGTFARIRSMAATTGGFLRRSLSLGGIGKGFGGAAGGLIGAAGMAGAMGIGGMFAPMLAAAPLVLGMLGSVGTAIAAVASPVGLLAAAIVGGAVAWVKFSENGRAAWQGILNVVLPIVETLKGTFGGVKDAIMAGDWAGAGRLAVAGLKLAVYQGLAEIEKAFPGTFNTILRVVGRVGDGIVAAWRKVTGFLKQQWDNWGKGTLDTIMEVAGLIPEIWKNAVEGIANSMLELAASSPLMGKLMKPILGVDMSNEQEKAQAMEEARRPVLKRNLEWSIQQAEKEGKDTTALKADLVKLGGPAEKVDILDDARKAVKQYTDNLRTEAAQGVQQGSGEVSTAIEDFMANLSSGVSVADAMAEFEAAKATAAKPAKPDEATPGSGLVTDPTDEAGIAAKGKRPTIGPTFSAAAAQAAGQMGAARGPEEKMANSIYDMAKTLRELGLLSRNQDVSNKQVVTMYERFLAAFQYG